MCENKLNTCLFSIILISICAVRFSSSRDDFDNDPKIVQNKLLDFSTTLNRLLHWKNQESANILFSSITIYAALLLMHLGSVGKTRAEIIAVLRITKDDEWPGVHEKFSRVFECISQCSQAGASQKYYLNATDVIFVDRMTLRKKFVSYVQSYYNSDIINVNFSSKEFEAVKIINEYIANRFENQVPKFYSELQTTHPKVILASCLDFRSEWKFPFRKSTTQRDIFHSTNGAIIVNMMQRVGKMPYANVSNLGAEVGRLMTNTDISLFIVLPYQSYGLSYFLDNLAPDDIKLIASSVNENHLVDFKLPQTTLKWHKNFNETLLRLGLNEIFTLQADFQNMINEDYSLDVKEIKHKANLEITEQRIEASSVTGVKISSTEVVEPMPSDSVARLLSNDVNSVDDYYDYGGEKFSDLQFYVNRPFFMFLYHHEIRSVLFFATVNDPNGN